MKCGVIYMAAGNSRRFAMAGRQGTNKLLCRLKEKPLFLHGLETLAELAERRSGVQVIVITRFPEILEAAEMFGMRGCLNPESELGAAYTIRRGVREARAAGPFDYLMFVTADQPYLCVDTLERFLDLGETGRFPVISAAWRKTADIKGMDMKAMEKPGESADRKAIEQTGDLRLGNPVMFHTSLMDELEGLAGDEGGRTVWRRYAKESGFVWVKKERELEDLDLPWDHPDFGNRSTLPPKTVQKTE